LEESFKTTYLRDGKFEAKLSTIRCKYSKPYDVDQFELKEKLLLPVRAMTRQNFNDRMSVMRRDANTTWSTDQSRCQDIIMEESEEGEVFEGDDWAEEQTWRKSRIFEFKDNQIFLDNLEELADILDLDVEDFCEGKETNNDLLE